MSRHTLIWVQRKALTLPWFFFFFLATRGIQLGGIPWKRAKVLFRADISWKEASSTEMALERKCFHWREEKRTHRVWISRVNHGWRGADETEKLGTAPLLSPLVPSDKEEVQREEGSTHSLWGKTNESLTSMMETIHFRLRNSPFSQGACLCVRPKLLCQLLQRVVIL